MLAIAGWNLLKGKKAYGSVGVAGAQSVTNKHVLFERYIDEGRGRQKLEMGADGAWYVAIWSVSRSFMDLKLGH